MTRWDRCDALTPERLTEAVDNRVGKDGSLRYRGMSGHRDFLRQAEWYRGVIRLCSHRDGFFIGILFERK